MANAWNEATWGQNAWGEQSGVNEILTGEVLTSSLGNETITADCNVTPTGISITATEGTVTEIIAVEVFPSGLPFTTNLGIADAGPDAMVTGLDTVTASVGSVEAYNLTGWGRYFWGQFVWNGTGDWVQVDLTGISLSSNLGTVDAAPDAEVTGIGFNASLAVGTVVIGEGNVAVTGEAMTASLGDSIGFTSIEVDLTGIGLSANLGSLAITGTASVDITGEAMIAAEGIVDPSPDATVTGIGFTADLAVGTVTIADANTDVTGEAMTASLGNESITGTANLTLTGFGITAAEGTVDPAPDATVTGIGFNASLAIGTVVIGEANVTVIGEGFSAGLGLGELDAVTFADVTGIAMSSSLGGVTAIGEATTGIGLTMALGTNRTLIWNQVNTGTAPTWTEVDTAA